MRVALPLALLLLNLLTFALFGLDKALARAQRRRIPEARLLGLALIGGTPGPMRGGRCSGTRPASNPSRAISSPSPCCRWSAAGWRSAGGWAG